MIDKSVMFVVHIVNLFYSFWQASLGSSSPGKRPTYTNPIFQSNAVYCVCPECSCDETVFRDINSKVKLKN